MPRKAMFFIHKIPVHLVIRGNSRKTIFAEEEDYQFYRKWLLESKDEQKIEIYYYVLMSNHVHLLLSASKTENISKFLVTKLSLVMPAGQAPLDEAELRVQTLPSSAW